MQVIWNLCRNPLPLGTGMGKHAIQEPSVLSFSSTLWNCYWGMHFTLHLHFMLHQCMFQCINCSWGRFFPVAQHTSALIYESALIPSTMKRGKNSSHISITFKLYVCLFAPSGRKDIQQILAVFQTVFETECWNRSIAEQGRLFWGQESKVIWGERIWKGWNEINRGKGLNLQRLNSKQALTSILQTCNDSTVSLQYSLHCRRTSCPKALAEAFVPLNMMVSKRQVNERFREESAS